jgi:hypothetical protein
MTPMVAASAAFRPIHGRSALAPHVRARNPRNSAEPTTRPGRPMPSGAGADLVPHRPEGTSGGSLPRAVEESLTVGRGQAT